MPPVHNVIYYAQPVSRDHEPLPVMEPAQIARLPTVHAYFVVL